MWQCFAFISGITMLKHPGKCSHKNSQWFGDAGTNTSHLKVSFLCLERILVFWTQLDCGKKLPTSTCANLKLHHKKNYEIKKNCSFSRRDIIITKISQVSNSNQSKYDFSLKMLSKNSNFTS